MSQQRLRFAPLGFSGIGWLAISGFLVSAAVAKMSHPRPRRLQAFLPARLMPPRPIPMSRS